jgi:hypothetical protein
VWCPKYVNSKYFLCLLDYILINRLNILLLTY